MNIFFRHGVLLCVVVFSTIISKTVLVTGGAGFIASHVAQALLQRSDNVIIVDNFNDGYNIAMKNANISLVKQTPHDGFLHVYQVDICDQEAMKMIINNYQPDVICHLAARAGVRTSIADPFEYYRSNVLGTLTIFELAHQCNIPHVVSASSSSIYCNEKGIAFVESDPVDKQLSQYGVTKRAGELLAFVYHHLYNISITNLRFFSVYGPRARMDMAPFIFMDAIYHDQPICVYGDGSVVRDFTFIDDIVDGIIKAIDTPLGYQIVNLGCGQPIVLSDFIATMEEVMKKNAQIRYAPQYLCDAHFTHADTTKAGMLLGYQPHTSLKEGLCKMYDWYINEFLAIEMNMIKREPSLKEIECFVE